MKMNFGIFNMTFLVIILLNSCGGVDYPDANDVTSEALFVKSVTPADGTTMESDSAIELVFSRPVETESIDERSLVVMKCKDESDCNDLANDAVDGDVVGENGIFSFADGDTKVSFRKMEGFSESSIYVVVATNRVISKNLMPLVQKPGRGKSPFISTFLVGSGSEGTEEGSASVKPSTTAVQLHRPSFLIINEVLYDADGSDTDGNVFIELYGEPGCDISDYVVNLVSGDDGKISDSIKFSSSKKIPPDGIVLIADSKTGKDKESNVADADVIENFDPQNGPDCVQLVDSSGSVIDAIGYGSPLIEAAENGQACFEGTPTAKVKSGESLTRTDGIDTNDNSVDFLLSDVPTPGGL